VKRRDLFCLEPRKTGLFFCASIGEISFSHFSPLSALPRFLFVSGHGVISLARGPSPRAGQQVRCIAFPLLFLRCFSKKKGVPSSPSLPFFRYYEGRTPLLIFFPLFALGEACRRLPFSLEEGGNLFSLFFLLPRTKNAASFLLYV